MTRRRMRRRQQNRGGRATVTPRSVVSGIKFKPPNSIRPTSFRPWNTYMVQHTWPHTSTKAIVVHDVADRLVVDNGLMFDSNPANGLKFEFKLIEAQVYGVTDQTITVNWYDSAGLDSENVSQCLHAKNQYARVGYRWPLSDQSHIHNSGQHATQTLFRIIESGQANDMALVRMRILWRSVEGSVLLQPLIPRPSTNSDLVGAVADLCSLLTTKLTIVD